jgi:hypothetical protein
VAIGEGTIHRDEEFLRQHVLPRSTLALAKLNDRICLQPGLETNSDTTSSTGLIPGSFRTAQKATPV